MHYVITDAQESPLGSADDFNCARDILEALATAGADEEEEHTLPTYKHHARRCKTRGFASIFQTPNNLATESLLRCLLPFHAL
jgi:hypothetical protein